MTNSEEKEAAVAASISFETLRGYLRAKNWKLGGYPLDGIETYVQTVDGRIKEAIQIPTTQESDRRVPYILDAARSVARFEGTCVDAALAEFAVFGFDRVRWRLASPDAEEGVAPLGDAVAFVKNISKVLSAAVKDVVRPELFHKKIISSETTELLNASKFGQTERGSFVVNVYVPVRLNSSSVRGDGENKPIFRRGLIHLMETLRLATKLIDEGTPEKFLEENAKAPIVASANLLEAVDETRVSDDSELDISVEWSPTEPIEAGVPSRARVTGKHSASFWNWSQVYRPHDRESFDSEFLAKVTAVSVQDRDEKGRPSGTATFQIIDAEDGYEATARLEANDFRLANACLMDDRIVAFRGKCERARKKATIDALSEFRVAIR